MSFEIILLKIIGWVFFLLAISYCFQSLNQPLDNKQNFQTMGLQAAMVAALMFIAARVSNG